MIGPPLYNHHKAEQARRIDDDVFRCWMDTETYECDAAVAAHYHMSISAVQARVRRHIGRNPYLKRVITTRNFTRPVPGNGSDWQREQREQANEIDRAVYERNRAGESGEKIAKDYGVTRMRIYQRIHRYRWRNREQLLDVDVAA